jgi:hypothetical protein
MRTFDSGSRHHYFTGSRQEEQKKPRTILAIKTIRAEEAREDSRHTKGGTTRVNWMREAIPSVILVKLKQSIRIC